MGVPEGEEREILIEKLFEEVTTENFLNMIQIINLHISKLKKLQIG